MLVTKLSSAHGTRVFRLHSALVLQMFVQRIPPTVLSSAILALCFLLFAALFPQVPMIRRLPGVAFTADVASVEGGTVRGGRGRVRAGSSRARLPAFRISCVFNLSFPDVSLAYYTVSNRSRQRSLLARSLSPSAFRNALTNDIVASNRLGLLLSRGVMSRSRAR